jgi:hypothetical protein
MGGRGLIDAGDGVDTLRAGPANDLLDAGPGIPDDCDGEGGIDTAKSCEILTGVRNAPEPLVRSPSPGAYPLPSDEPS